MAALDENKTQEIVTVSKCRREKMGNYNTSNSVVNQFMYYSRKGIPWCCMSKTMPYIHLERGHYFRKNEHQNVEFYANASSVEDTESIKGIVQWCREIWRDGDARNKRQWLRAVQR